MQFLVKTLAGLEGVLAEELKALGAEKLVPLTRAIQVDGDLRLLYRANLELRTAIRILVPIATFRVRNERELYNQIFRIDWSQYMELEDTFAIDATSNSPTLRHSKYVALKTKDAIADQFRKKLGARPNVELENPTLRINIHINQEQCTVSLDSSGASLHKRGYRVDSLEAPINEVLAAGMVLLSGWQRDCPILDPMCGSGTLLIEAAMYAYNIPPQLQRPTFGFKHWKNYDAKLWEDVIYYAKQDITDFPHPILGFDKDFRAIKVSSQNVIGAHLEGKIEVERKKFERLEPSFPKGMIIMNPPYDERLPSDDIGAFYQMIGDRLKNHFTGYEAWIISSNKEALKHVGLRPSKKMTLFNGALECKFQQFELYEGSKKQKKAG